MGRDGKECRAAGSGIRIANDSTAAGRARETIAVDSETRGNSAILPAPLAEILVGQKGASGYLLFAAWKRIARCTAVLLRDTGKDRGGVAG